MRHASDRQPFAFDDITTRVTAIAHADGARP
jgi:hypothetical protein